MKKTIEFDAVILREVDKDISYCDIPFDVDQTFGKKRLKIKATIDNVVYRGLLAPYSGRYFLLINKDIRTQLGKSFGETIRIVLEEDTEPRIVDIPNDLNQAMTEKGVKAYFDTLSFTHQKEFARWITDAKRPETRQNRIDRAIKMLQNKQKPHF